VVLHYGLHVCDYGHDFRLCDQGTSLQNGRDSDLEQIENDFKDPEDGFWDKNNLKSIKSNCEVLENQGECHFARVEYIWDLNYPFDHQFYLWHLIYLA